MKVNVMIADAERIAAHADEIISRIPQYYALQYQCIKKKQEAEQELAAGWLLKQCLGVSCDEQIIRGTHGKPGLRSGTAFFNLSHSGEYAVLAVAEADVGVDIEQITQVHWPSVRKVYSRPQRERLERAPERERPQLFTRFWTEREAGLKLVGTGFAENPAPETDRPGGWTVRSVRYGDYMITCAAQKQFDLSVEEMMWNKAIAFSGRC